MLCIFFLILKVYRILTSSKTKEILKVIFPVYIFQIKYVNPDFTKKRFNSLWLFNF